MRVEGIILSEEEYDKLKKYKQNYNDGYRVVLSEKYWTGTGCGHYEDMTFITHDKAVEKLNLKIDELNKTIKEYEKGSEKKKDFWHYLKFW